MSNTGWVGTIGRSSPCRRAPMQAELKAAAVAVARESETLIGPPLHPHWFQ